MSNYKRLLATPIFFFSPNRILGFKYEYPMQIFIAFLLTNITGEKHAAPNTKFIILLPMSEYVTD